MSFFINRMERKTVTAVLTPEALQQTSWLINMDKMLCTSLHDHLFHCLRPFRKTSLKSVKNFLLTNKLSELASVDWFHHPVACADVQRRFLGLILRVILFLSRGVNQYRTVWLDDFVSKSTLLISHSFAAMWASISCIVHYFCFICTAGISCKS